MSGTLYTVAHKDGRWVARKSPEGQPREMAYFDAHPSRAEAEAATYQLYTDTFRDWDVVEQWPVGDFDWWRDRAAIVDAEIDRMLRTMPLWKRAIFRLKGTTDEEIREHLRRVDRAQWWMDWKPGPLEIAKGEV